MNAQISVFVTCVEAITYLLLYNLRDCTFKWDKLLMVIDYLIFFSKRKKFDWIWFFYIFIFLFCFPIFECQMYEFMFRMSNVLVNFSNVLFIVFLKKTFWKDTTWI